jgi:arylsulfotransferase ASST
MRNRRLPARVPVALLVAAAALHGLSSFSTAAAQIDLTQLQISSEPSLSPTFDLGVSDYVTRCESGSPVRLSVSAPAGTEVDVDRQGFRAGAFTAQTHLTAGQGYAITASSGADRAWFHVRCLPTDFTGWSVSRPRLPEAEWYMVTPFTRTDFQPPSAGVSRDYVAIFDTNGVPVWWMKAPELPMGFVLLSKGHVGWSSPVSLDNQERRLDGSLVRRVKAALGTTDPHEFRLLPDGNYLIATTRTLSGFSACGRQDLPVGDSGIEVVAPDGSLVWSWWALDHIPISETPTAWCSYILSDSARTGNFDVSHINSVVPVADGYVASFRHLDAVYKISKADGSIVWKLGGTPRAESLTAVGDPVFASDGGFWGQHDARVLSDGSLTVHDNGYHPGAQRAPRAVRYVIDPVASTATLVEEVHDPGALQPALCCGSARRLPGGHWVMSWGSNGAVTELTGSGARVFTLEFENNLFSYRAHPVLPGVITRAALRAGMDAQYPRWYPHPRRGSPILAPLVVAYQPCSSPNRSHVPPLSGPSCSPPVQVSPNLNVGTPTVNGAPAGSVGSVRLDTVHDQPPESNDLRITASITDVRCRPGVGTCGSLNTQSGADYTGELEARVRLRLTDLSDGPATSRDIPFPAELHCAATQTGSIGASCAIATTANSIVAGAVQTGGRAVWNLGRVVVYDGGSSGVAGAADAKPFEDQGVFVP